MKIQIQKNDAMKDILAVDAIVLGTGIVSYAIGIARNDERLKTIGSGLGVTSIALSAFGIGTGTTLTKS